MQIPQLSQFLSTVKVLLYIIFANGRETNIRYNPYMKGVGGSNFSMCGDLSLNLVAIVFPNDYADESSWALGEECENIVPLFI